MKNYFLGIDVSKGYADFVIIDDAKREVRKTFKLMDTAEDHQELLRMIKLDLKGEVNCIYCGVESTGGYENNWFRTLSDFKDQRVRIVRINPVRIHHQSRAGLQRTVTDKVAANTIAHYLSDNHEDLFANPQLDIAMANARKVYNMVATLNKQKTQLSNQFEKIIYSNIPELITYIRNGVPNWLLHFLKKYSNKDAISKARPSNIAKIKGITLDKAQTIQSKVKTGIGAPGDIYINHIIKSLCSKILALDKQIKDEKKFLTDNFKDKRVNILESIKGIGSYTAIGVLIEIEDVSRFASASHLCSYFGVHPTFKESGDGKIKSRMSKKGRSSYRSLLYMGARNVAIHNPYFKSFYIAQRAKGMHHNAAIGAIMNKLTRIIFGMLKSENTFDPQVDHQNQIRSLSKITNQEIEQTVITQKKELEQAIMAPVSKRKITKIKKELSVSFLAVEESARSKALSHYKHIKMSE